jgi:predicted RNA binding protein YcfA (HicA-like mRNA interferase family)
MKYRDVIKLIEADGWYLKRTSGSHHVYKHPTKTNTVVVAYHGKKDIPDGTVKGILKQAGLDD